MRSDEESKLELNFSAADIRAMKRSREASRAISPAAYEILLDAPVDERARKTFEGYEPFDLSE